MSDFIYTIASDDEVPGSPPASTSRTSSKSTATHNSNKKSAKLSRKQQLAQKQQLKLKQKKDKKGKRKQVDDVSSDEEESEAEMNGAASDEGEKMASDFIFDGLGGGFVGETRNSVWDSGEAYLTKRPNAIPRVTVDEIIARRAPERREKAERKAQQAAEEQDSEAEQLENEMMAELEAGIDENEESDSENLELDESENSFGGIEDDSELEGEDIQMDSEDEKEGSELEEDPEAEESEDEGFGEGEDWLGIEQDKRENVEANENSSAESGTDAPTGFAALADLEDEVDSEAEDVTATNQVADGEDDDVSKSEAAAGKAFFTSHSNQKNSSAGNSFSTLPNCNLSRQVLLALGSLSLSRPTPIQRECIPVAMMGKDIVASSATGSGKTVAFWVGVLERLLHRDRKHPATRVVVMTPTRELAVQVHGVGVALARHTDIQFCLCVGGLSLKVQEAELKNRPDVVVSTPGRLIDHVRNTPCFSMDKVEILVLDEADRMLEEGFRAELEEIISAAPRSRQTLLFSATVTESVASLSRLSMNKPVRVKIDEMGATAEGLVQEFLRVRGDKAGEAIERGFRSGERTREAILISLCSRSFSAGRTIIFFRSKAQAHRMKILFSLYGNGLHLSDELHGDLTQEARLTSLKKFRQGESNFLLATDLASRGLDIKGIENVINYEMPRSIEIYLHRVGRTARAGKKGRAITLVGESDRKLVKLAMKHAPPESIKQRVLPVEIVNDVTAELKELESEVKAVQREEQEEKQFRRGDMELTKGSNLLQYENEIKSRPARTWFQTQSEKLEAKQLGANEHNSKFTANKKRAAPEELEKAPAPKRTPFSGLSRKEKRRKMAAAEYREDREEGKMQNINSSIRSAKKANLPKKMSVVAEARDPGYTPKKPKKKNGKGKFDKELGINGKFERERETERNPSRERANSSRGGRGGRGGRGRGGKR